MKIGHETTLSDLAFIVCTELEAHGITAVLSGGGAATIYAPDAYRSRDLDFIIQFMAATFPPDDLPLRNLGFSERNSIYWHPETQFTVEFPSGPLAIGSEVITEWVTLEKNHMRLHVLSPTDSVRDRLCAFLYWNDFSGLAQGLPVAKRNEVDLDAVRDWLIRENAEGKFNRFLTELRRE